MPRRRAIIGITAVVGCALAAALVWFVSGGLSGSDSVATPPPPLAAARQVPEGAVDTARDLVGGDDERTRRALSPALGELLPAASAIAPPGSTLELEPDSWGQRGSYASAIGQLTEPGEPARRVFVGFVLRDERWRVTALEPTQ